MNASKFNKKATLPIIYALTAFATPIDERKEKITIKRGRQTFNNNKIRLILNLKQLVIVFTKNITRRIMPFEWQKIALKK
ncbi:hypothetical protein J4G63_05240 [Aeromonas sobria]|uniref:hypothetical protein n=1 Tax=Aeromonas sobria TaxID=646 RepID=UPI001114BE6C|nr:hypothetical protein [Aeromonas sobria]MBS4686648.1 hypothetical protein [Aeromonas sobria]